MNRYILLLLGPWIAVGTIPRFVGILDVKPAFVIPLQVADILIVSVFMFAVIRTTINAIRGRK